MQVWFKLDSTSINVNTSPLRFHIEIFKFKLTDMDTYSGVPGFLEPDELSSMIKGADKCGKPLLPGIEEDMRRSTDSISTLESESLTLESLEADFFEDIRASIQKSSKASNRTSSSVAAPRETDTQSICRKYKKAFL